MVRIKVRSGLDLVSRWLVVMHTFYFFVVAVTLPSAIPVSTSPTLANRLLYVKVVQ